jgi:hypothetical protein
MESSRRQPKAQDMRSKPYIDDCPDPEVRREWLEENLAKYDALKLECDGLTRVLHWVLQRAGVPHEIYFGEAFVYHPEDEHGDGNLVRPHWWIQCGDYIIDYRLGMWCDEEAKAPKGIFKPEKLQIKDLGEVSHVEYKGQETSFPEMNETVFDILVRTGEM